MSDYIPETKNTLDTLNFPGQVNVLRAEIITHTGRSIDVSAIMGELSIYEDMFSNTMSGHVYLEDALDLINNMPIIGQELFMLELQTPSFKRTIKKRFYIYKLEHRTIGPRVQQYILQFCSSELITSVNTKVSRAFSGKISDTVIKLVAKSPYGDDRNISSDQQLFYEPTKNSLDFIAPYWSPLQTINWLCEKSINDRGVANYLFYESNQGFEFYSLDRLLSNGVVAKYTYGDTNSKTVSPEEDFEKMFSVVESVETDVSFDYLRNVSAGMYGSVLYTYDTTHKTITRNLYDYFSEFNKAKHLENNPVNTTGLIYKKQASIHHVLKNNYLYGANKPIIYSEFYQQRNSLLAQIQAFRFNIEVFGRTDIKVGDIIDFKMIAKKEVTTGEIDDPTKMLANDFIGRCLIIAIRHSIVQGTHKMIMEIASDSFKEPIKN